MFGVKNRAGEDVVTIRRGRLEGTGGAVRGPGRRLRGALIHKLGTAILSGQYKPGDIMPGEVLYSEELNVSRGAYREAIQVLAAKGLVASRPKAGTRVQPRERWNMLDPDVLGWAFAGEPDIDFVQDLFELRSIIEPAAARLAAARRTDADIAVMGAALAAMEQYSLSSEEGRAADREFHSAILNATGNHALQLLIASIGAAVHWTTQFKERSVGFPRDPVPDHALVYEAIRAGDGAAADAAMSTLVDLALQDTRGVIERSVNAR